MTPSLTKRATRLTEQMDHPDCDLDKLCNTYRQFPVINRLLTRWKKLFNDYIAPIAVRKPVRILDIGCGGGDICIKLAAWGNRQGFDLNITGIDPDPKAADFRETLTYPPNVHFRKARSSDLVNRGDSFDVVISNHLLHHLNQHQILKLCRDSEQLARNLVLFNDIHRHPIGYRLFSLITPPLFRDSFIVEDGLTSIRRSFTESELTDLAPKAWRVQTLNPFRLLLILEKPEHTNSFSYA